MALSLRFPGILLSGLFQRLPIKLLERTASFRLPALNFRGFPPPSQSLSAIRYQQVREGI
jgi:hypothetical protein